MAARRDRSAGDPRDRRHLTKRHGEQAGRRLQRRLIEAVEAVADVHAVLRRREGAEQPVEERDDVAIVASLSTQYSGSKPWMSTSASTMEA